MGIKDLFKILEEHAPNAIKKVSIKDYKKKVLGIDANLMIYKVVYALRKNGYDLKNDGLIVTHIHMMLQKLIGFRKQKIVPVFVFDSHHGVMKEGTMERRREYKEKQKKKYEAAVGEDEKKKYFYMGSDVSEQEIDDVKRLINCFGYPIVIAKEEADAQLAYLSRRGLIDAIVTDDLDILLFGGYRVLKNFSVSEKKQFYEVDLLRALSAMGFDQIDLIHLGIVLGCDYCPKISGVGAKSAYNYVKNKDEKDFSGFTRVVEYFSSPPIKKIDRVNVKKLDVSRLADFLRESKYNDDQVDKVLEKI